jgi:hypothetical protein
MSDIAPYNVIFNIGIEEIYGTFIISYYQTLFPAYETKFIGLGIGIGSNVFVNKNIYINPKLVGVFTLENENTLFFSLRMNFGYKINSILSIFLGSSVTWLNHPIEHHDFHYIGIPYLGKTYVDEKNTIKYLETEIGIRIIF